MDDQWIATAVMRRDEVAFDKVVSKYSKLLWVVAFSIMGNRADVEELVSDVFWRFWQQPEKFDANRGSLKQYLTMLTRSMAINKLHLKQSPLTSSDDFLLENVEAPKVNNEIFWQALFKAIEALNEPTKKICFQRFFLELKPAVISERLNLSVTEVNNRLYQGKKKIRPILRQLLEEEGQ
ncbi:RNA polymerase sigma factor [Xylocopilactobacillus apicola]|uniref:RNA polymerase sigma-70 factor, ECF subfamily n=1 Tax=Xylocopilactobacillus apicola TaxID=2932184 RepID=A0AAU9DEB5_9LACO|nr:sigma-70 family RNA polymerase sigma factor [Xylocopilactobacillus apicola]BDR59207.1 hypothetical protein XA3_16480 [Xylocopilactobacillus apicola]